MCKKWVWDSGLRVPLIIRFPARYRHLAPSQPGTTSDQLVSFVDFAPTLLSLLGVQVPAHMQGHAFLGTQSRPPRECVFAIRDRMAEFHDLVRVVRDKKYQYHRNFLPHLPWAPFTSYTLTMPTAQVCTRLHEQGRLDPVQDRFFRPKPTEELYDIAADPHMIHNLADDPQYADELQRMRTALRLWQLQTRDLGMVGEYEMHRRAADSTPYEFGQDENRYPLARILPVAELASRRQAANLPQLLELLQDDEPAVRWWAALGLVMLGDAARSAEDPLRQLLRDPSPLVRIAAAEGLYQFGDVQQAREALVAELAHETPFIRLQALNALYRMGSDAQPAVPAIRQASMEGIFPAEFLNRMVEYMPEQLGTDQ
jgi:hypothetical protein